MKNYLTLLATLTLIFFKNGETEALFTEYMDGYKSTITVDDPRKGSFSSGILKSHFIGSYKTSFNKTLLLSAPSDCGIIAAIRMVDLRPNKIDKLTLFSPFDPRRQLVFINAVNSYHNKTNDPLEWTTFNTDTGQLSVRFETGADGSTWGYDGFELIYTAYKRLTNCGSGKYKCLNGRCISNFLTCDDHNHCGDRSDQFNCPQFDFRPKVNVGAIVGGVVFLVIAVACIIFIFVRRASRSRTSVQTIISHPPPAYSQPGPYYPPPPPAYMQNAPGNTNLGYR